MGGTLFALHYTIKEKNSYKRKTKHVINTNAQFVTLNNNNYNKLYTLFIYAY